LEDTMPIVSIFGNRRLDGPLRHWSYNVSTGWGNNSHMNRCVCSETSMGLIQRNRWTQKRRLWESNSYSFRNGPWEILTP
jgi:hypothetical protein